MALQWEEHGDEIDSIKNSSYVEIVINSVLWSVLLTAIIWIFSLVTKDKSPPHVHFLVIFFIFLGYGCTMKWFGKNSDRG